MAIITVENTFHNTTTKIRATICRSYGNDFYYASITRSQLKKIHRELCGIKGCLCSSRIKATYQGAPITLYEDGVPIC